MLSFLFPFLFLLLPSLTLSLPTQPIGTVEPISSTPSPSASASASASTSPGSATILNLCNHNITLWTVSSSVSPPNTLPTNSNITSPLTSDPETGGIAIKITREPNGLVSAAPTLNFAYALNDAEGSVYYDLSTVFGDFLQGETATLATWADDGQCPDIEWKQGQRPKDAQTQACMKRGVNLVLTLCAA